MAYSWGLAERPAAAPGAQSILHGDGLRTGKSGVGPLLAIVIFASLPVLGRAEPIPWGVAQQTVDISGTEIELHTYKPAHYAGRGLLVTLHGLNRNASGYLDHTRALADRHGLLLVAPLFDRERFPTWRYQAAGIARYARNDESRPLDLEPPSSWTATILLEIVESVRSAEHAPKLPYSLIGHSAGAQHLSRLAAFVPNGAQRIVIANPSTYVWPSRNAHFPYGFGGLPDELGGDEAIRRYLAQPITLFLGTADVKRDRSLNVTERAMRQGPNRLARGVTVFDAARTLARERGWAFNWRLVEAQSVGHSARSMYASAEADAALLGR